MEPAGIHMIYSYLKRVLFSSDVVLCIPSPLGFACRFGLVSIRGRPPPWIIPRGYSLLSTLRHGFLLLFIFNIMTHLFIKLCESCIRGINKFLCGLPARIGIRPSLLRKSARLPHLRRAILFSFSKFPNNC